MDRKVRAATAAEVISAAQDLGEHPPMVPVLTERQAAAVAGRVPVVVVPAALAATDMLSSPNTILSRSRAE